MLFNLLVVLGVIAAAVALFATGRWVASRVITPWLTRRAEAAAVRARRQAELDEILFRQQKIAAEQAWLDLQAHRKRLEQGLDDLHRGDGPG